MNLFGGCWPRRWKITVFVGAAALLLSSCGGSGGGGGGGTLIVAGDLASVTPDPVTAAHNSIEGDFAADIIRGTHFTSLTVEIDYAASRPPTPAAIAFLEQRLTERCNKPMGIHVVVDEAIPDSEFPSVVTVSKMQQIEDAHRNTFSDEPSHSAALYLLYVKGASSLDTGQGKILGLAHRGSSIAFFMDNALSLSNATFTELDYEAYAITHECGHLMGLVNLGVPMVNPHEDPAHPNHDTDPNCIMFWAIGGGSGLPVFGDPDFAQFNENCILDLEAFGGL